MNKTRRLFVGIPLSAPLRRRLTQEMEEWPKDAVFRTAQENLHVTLFFLGFVQEEQVPEVCAKVGEACRDTESFELIFNGMRYDVDDAEAPKMIWLAGEANDALKHLLETIEKAFSAFVAEKKVYRPHVTLAKIKKSKWLKLAEKPKLKETLSIVEPVETIAVFESLSLEGKRRYEQIDTFPLQ
ncbi:MAG: 2'-5' RNA ligase [Candidatus Moranbacteria bacterium RIFCSPHIGHO2_12_FULL_54_9]|nr:MAG: 2'-5' RNA ligase [Candidatus Moranbacteria bacterium RIFCSPHIGHO2_01_FULL_54_31]OGI25280.1 MAG: 2'-5' RNA ligase [Candidatus Moranbacteria bacterium RIFCSPHIGHO2_12_FULL_54_9]